MFTFFSFHYEELKGKSGVATSRKGMGGAPAYTVLSILQGEDDA
jgi:hypothetical protein